MKRTITFAMLTLLLFFGIFTCRSWAENINSTGTEKTQALNKEDVYTIADDFSKCAGNMYAFAEISKLYPELQNTVLTSNNTANAWKYGAAWVLYSSETIKDFKAALGYAGSQTEQTYRSWLAAFETNDKQVLEKDIDKLGVAMSFCGEAYGELQLEMTNQIKRFLYENMPEEMPE